MTSPTMTSGRPADVPAYIAQKLRFSTPERVVTVGEQTGWWTSDDVDWALQGGDGPRPPGWTLDQLDEVPAGLLQEARASVALDGDTYALNTGPVTVDVGEVAPQPALPVPVDTGPSSYVHVVLSAEVFADPSYQRPLDRARVRRMAADWNPRMIGVIDVSDRGPDTPPGARFAVVNGQHRWAAAVEHGEQQLVATIHEGLDLAAEARLMFELDRGTKALTPWDRWRSRRTAGDPAVAAIEATAAQHGMAVHSNGFSAIGAAERILARDGHQQLNTVVLILTEAWSPTAAAVKAPMLTGLATVLRTHGGQLDAARLVDALRRTTPQAMRAKADAARELHRGNLGDHTATVMVAAYNALPGPRLAAR